MEISLFPLFARTPVRGLLALSVERLAFRVRTLAGEVRERLPNTDHQSLAEANGVGGNGAKHGRRPAGNSAAAPSRHGSAETFPHPSPFKNQHSSIIPSSFHPSQLDPWPSTKSSPPGE